MIVRKATLADRTVVLDLCERFYARTGIVFKWSPKAAEQLFNTCLSDVSFVCFVLENDEGIQGCLVAHVSNHLFAHCRIAQEIAWFVEDGYFVHARSLLRAYETWARRNGCNCIVAAGIGSNPRTGRFYGALGFAPQEKHFIKAIG